jgi:hypothetical protein
VAECGIAREVFKQYLTGFFVLITDEPEPKQETPECVVNVIIKMSKKKHLKNA